MNYYLQKQMKVLKQKKMTNDSFTTVQTQRTWNLKNPFT